MHKIVNFSPIQKGQTKRIISTTGTPDGAFTLTFGGKERRHMFAQSSLLDLSVQSPALGKCIQINYTLWYVSVKMRWGVIHSNSSGLLNFPNKRNWISFCVAPMRWVYNHELEKGLYKLSTMHLSIREWLNFLNIALPRWAPFLAILSVQGTEPKSCRTGIFGRITTSTLLELFEINHKISLPLPCKAYRIDCRGWRRRTSSVLFVHLG